MGTQRVVITGMGWVTPLGLDVESTWAGMMAGRSGTGRITRFDARTFKTNFAAEVKGFDLAQRIGPVASQHAGAGLNAQFALAAASEAFTQSRLGDCAGLNARRFGLYLASGEGTLDSENYLASHVQGWDEGRRAVDARAWARAAKARMTAVREVEQEANMTVSHVAWAFGCRGPASNCLTACAASIQAIGEACEQIRRGDADVMFAGGAHSMIHPLGITGFSRLTALSPRSEEYATVPRPFDQTRDGFVMGEGAGMLVLESIEHARARGATILAEVAGYGSSADAYRITDMHPQGGGPAAAMGGALAQAGIDPRALGPDARPLIHWVSAHGTGTKENDKIETAGLKKLFGEDGARKVPVSSIKSMMGHLIAAAGVSNVISSVQAIRTGMIPPTINYATPDAGLDLDYVPNVPRDLSRAGGVHACLCNAYGFGGQNDCLVIRAV